MVVGMAGLTWWGCNNQDSPTIHDEWTGIYHEDQNYKTALDHKPLKGLDEQGYTDAIGSAENMDKLLKLIAGRVVGLMNNNTHRGNLLNKLKNMTEGKANLSAVAIEFPEIGNELSRDFKSSMSSEGIGGSLVTQTVANDLDKEAFLGISQSLFGLQAQLIIPSSGTWNTEASMPVFHMPVLDESETTHFDGFNPDGSSISLSKAEGIPYPFVYLRDDEEFFIKPENIPTNQDPEMSWEPRDYLWDTMVTLAGVSRAWADRPDGHESCYDEYEIDGVGLWWEHDHEGQPNDDDPEMYTLIALQYKYNEDDYYEAWDPYKRKNLYDADLKKRWNNLSPRPRFYWHSYKDCDFSWDWSWHPEGDHAIFEVWEKDNGFNQDDPVGKWRDVPTTVSSYYQLGNKSGEQGYQYIDNGWEDQDAKLRFEIGEGD